MTKSFIKSGLFSFLLFGSLSTLLTPALLSAYAQNPAPSAANAIELISGDSAESMRRLEQSQHKANFMLLANHFETQKNKFFCGPTSGVIVLNALRISNPQPKNPLDQEAYDWAAKEYLPNPTYIPVFEKYTQNNFFNSNTDQIKTRLEVFGKPKIPGAKPSYGYGIRELHETLKAHGLNSKLSIVGAETNNEAIREELVQALSTPQVFAVVNYSRPALGQKGGGHISPLGAYDQASNSFLIMDVNPSTARWVWVKSDDLINAMRTFDGDMNENRGYVILSEGSNK